MRIACISLALCVLAMEAFAYSGPTPPTEATLRGQITDELGGLIPGAVITLVDAKGVEKTTTTTREGVYVINGLAPGKYTLRVSAPGFALYENEEVTIFNRPAQTFDVKMAVETRKENVDVQSDTAARVTLDPDSTAHGTVMRGKDLDILPDDPDQLAADLKMLAGPGEGPNGNEILVDQFTGAKIPNKASIREVRLNANPYTAEQENFGFGRIQIFTKPGATKVQGQSFFNYNNEHLNARNPFAPTSTPYLSKLYGANLSGPVFGKKGAYFFDFQRREVDDTATINATVLDPSFNIVPFHAVAPIPERLNSFSARFDYQLNKDNTLVARYDYTRSRQTIGFIEFALPSRSYVLANEDHDFRVNETAVLSPTVLNETRFLFRSSTVDRDDDNLQVAINVPGAFLGGGPQIGMASRREHSFDLNNTTTWARDLHTFKAGLRFRYISVDDVAPVNFGGTFTFDSIQQYQNVVLGVAGARPSQFSIAGGNPKANVHQYEVSGFGLDDWHMLPNFTLSYGVRYETQSNIHDRADFAPRISFAWAPGSDPKNSPKTVIRGGVGYFYSRFSEDLTLDANRYNGVTQQQFLINNPPFFSTVPSADVLAGLSVPQTVRQIDPDASAVHVLGTSISIERQLTQGSTLSLAYILKRSTHLQRSRNINAPLPGTFDPDNPSSAVRPFGNAGNIFVFESDGKANDHTLVLTYNGQLKRGVFVYGRAGLSLEKGNTEGPYFFPANSYDPNGDFGYLANDRRGFAVAAIGYPLPRWGIRISSTIFAVSANTFNITTGQDNNGDGVFNDRPAFASDLSKPGVIVTPFGAFDPNPGSGETIVPRSFGRGSGLVTLSMRVTKSFRFGTLPGNSAQGGKQAGPAEKRFTLSLYGLGQNILNHTNLGTFVGVLTSPNFGQATTILNTPRRVEMGIRFEF